MIKSLCPRCAVSYSKPWGQCSTCGGLLLPVGSDPLLGSELGGKYFLTEVISHGGMGSVYRARQRGTMRDFAVKVLRSDFVQHPSAVERFRREVRVVSQLQHPNVVWVLEHGVDDGHHYLVMELLEDQTLDRVISDAAPLRPTRALSIAAQISEALGEAHALDVVHRDVKPANIILVPKSDGRAEHVKVLDFGIAKVLEVYDTNSLTGVGEVCGTATYMSPEHLEKDAVEPRSDLYSLSVVLFEMLCGVPPFRGDSLLSTMAMHVQAAIPALSSRNPEVDLPRSFDLFFRRAMAKQPQNRPASAAAYKLELLDLLHQVAPQFKPRQTTEMLDYNPFEVMRTVEDTDEPDVDTSIDTSLDGGLDVGLERFSETVVETEVEAGVGPAASAIKTVVEGDDATTMPRPDRSALDRPDDEKTVRKRMEQTVKVSKPD